MKKQRFTALAVAGLILALPVGAQQRSVVAFAKGASSATLKGSIEGDQDHSDVVDARAGQTMTVDFRPSNASAHFNATAPGADAALFSGSTSGNRFSGTLTVGGPHVVQVYLMRSAARRNETANSTLADAHDAARRLQRGAYR